MPTQDLESFLTAEHISAAIVFRAQAIGIATHLSVPLHA